MEIGEIKRVEKWESKVGENRKVRKIEAVLLLCLTSLLQLSGLGGPNRSIKVSE